MARKWTKLHGQLYLDRQSGDVQMRYGEGQYARHNIGNIKGTKVYKRVLETYGKPEGKEVRKKAAMAIIKNMGVDL